tara:strand:+ start:12182 stop:12679 length:498 start_codon:yes stop_codon:yes gene_type:complete
MNRKIFPDVCNDGFLPRMTSVVFDDVGDIPTKLYLKLKTLCMYFGGDMRHILIEARNKVEGSESTCVVLIHDNSDNKIVAWGTVSKFDEDIKESVINVWTNGKYRRQGFGKRVGSLALKQAMASVNNKRLHVYGTRQGRPMWSALKKEFASQEHTRHISKKITFI